MEISQTKNAITLKSFNALICRSFIHLYSVITNLMIPFKAS